MKKLLLVIAVLISFCTLSIAQPSGSDGDHQERRSDTPKKEMKDKKDNKKEKDKKAKKDDKRYPANRYYYSETDGRHYHRYYLPSHRNVRCNDGVVVRAKKKNACKKHGGEQYFW